MGERKKQPMQTTGALAPREEVHQRLLELLAEQSRRVPLAVGIMMVVVAAMAAQRMPPWIPATWALITIGVLMARRYWLALLPTQADIPTDQRVATGTSCTDITVSDMKLNGEPIVMTETYLVTVNNFLADGGDGFSVFTEIPSSERIGGGGDLDALIAYFEANSPISDPGTDRVTEVR